jgi:hypothetical protein
MLAVFNGLPQYGSALLRSRHIRDLTCNRYGLVIDAADKRFEPNRIQEDLTIPPTREASSLLTRPRPGTDFIAERILSVRFLVLLVGVALLASTSTRLVFRYGGEIPPFRLHEATAACRRAAAGRFLSRSTGHAACRWKGPIARGQQPYAFQRRARKCIATSLVNPVAVNSGEAFSRGQQAIHGVLPALPWEVGRWDEAPSPLLFLKAPTLHSDQGAGMERRSDLCGS